MERHFPYRGFAFEGALVDFAVRNGLEVEDAATTRVDANMVELNCRGSLSAQALSDRWTTSHLVREHSYHTVTQEDGVVVLRFVTSGG